MDKAFDDFYSGQGSTKSIHLETLDEKIECDDKMQDVIKRNNAIVEKRAWPSGKRK